MIERTDNFLGEMSDAKARNGCVTFGDGFSVKTSVADGFWTTLRRCALFGAVSRCGGLDFFSERAPLPGRFRPTGHGQALEGLDGGAGQGASPGADEGSIRPTPKPQKRSINP